MKKTFHGGRGSILQNYSDYSKDVLHGAYTQAMRSAVNSIDLSELDQITSDMKNIGSKYGVSFCGELRNRLMMQNGSYSTSVGVFDNNVPFLQRGLGTKRLLSMGMNIHSSTDGRLILIDEIETGLEPYRISTLIKQLRSEFKMCGQVIFTTHSRSVVCECSADELNIISERQGQVSLLSLAEEETKNEVQAIIRSEPDAFLCRRLIVCEGKTEIGILRALDDHQYNIIGSRFSHYGAGVALGGGGNKLFKLAKLLKHCGYDVCILMDSDVSKEEEHKKEVEEIGIKVFSWEQGHAIEEQLFKDVDVHGLKQLLDIAVENKGFESVRARLVNEIENIGMYFDFVDEHIELLCDIDVETRVAIGRVAKGKSNTNKQSSDNGWFKRIDLGEQVGKAVFIDGQVKKDSYFESVIDNVKDWIYCDETRRD